MTFQLKRALRRFTKSKPDKANLSSIRNGLYAYYPLNERLGGRGNATDLQAPIAAGTVNISSGPGHINEWATNFTDSTSGEYLRTESGRFSLGSNVVTATGWFYPTSTGRHMGVVGNCNSRFEVKVDRDYGGIIFEIVLDTGGAIVLNTRDDDPQGSNRWDMNSWNFFCMRVDAVAGTFDVQVNDDIFMSTTFASDTLDVITNNGNNFKIGATVSDSERFAGLIENIGIWSRLLTQQEIDLLWNNGDGINISEPVSDTILSNISNYWRMEEVGGKRYDAISENHLSENNAVPVYRPSVLGNAADFTASDTNYLTGDTLVMGDTDFTIAGWFKLKSVATNHQVFYVWEPTTTNRSYAVWFNNSGDTLNFSCAPSGSTSNLETVTSGALVADEWYFFVAKHDSVNNEISISVNASNWYYQNHSLGTYSGTAVVTIGYDNDSSYSDMQVSNIGVWNRILTLSEETALYNNGNGWDFLPITDKLNQDVIAHWRLNEGADSVRVDSLGVYDLTDINTVDVEPAVINNGAVFNSASNNSLHGSNELNFTKGIGMAFWVRFDNNSSRQRFIEKRTGTTVIWHFDFKTSGTVLAFDFRTTNGEASITATWTPVVGQWYHIAVSFLPEGAGDNTFMWIDGVVVGNESRSGTLVQNTNEVFKLSRNDLTGAISYLTFWDRPLSNYEVGQLYNNGYGLDFITDDVNITDDIISFWKLHEESGTRYDSFGVNHLTDNNTVGVSKDEKIGNVGDFASASNESLSLSSFSVSGSFTITTWFSVDDFSNIHAIIGKWEADNQEIALDFNSFINVLEFSVTTLGTEASKENITFAESNFDANTLYFAAISYDANSLSLTATILGEGIELNDSNDIGVARYETEGPFHIGALRATAYNMDGSIGLTGIWNRVLKRTEIDTLFNYYKGYEPVHNLDLGLRAHYSLDETSGQRDDIKNGLNLTDNNTVLSTVGKVGNAALFDSANTEYLSHAHDALLNPDTSWTISFWFKASSPIPINGMNIVNKWETTGNQRGYVASVFNASDNAVIARYTTSTDGSDANRNDTEGVTRIIPNEWYHLVYVYDDVDGYIRVYVNGTLDAEDDISSGGIHASNDELYVGAYLGTSYAVDGAVDELSLFEIALSEAEIQYIYNSGNGRELIASNLMDDLHAYYRMNEAGDLLDELYRRSREGYKLERFGDGMLVSDGKPYLSSEFDGLEDTYVATDVNALDFSGSFTINTWVKISNVALDEVIFERDTSFKLEMNSNDLVFSVSSDGETYDSTVTVHTPIVDTWYMITVWFDSDNQVIGGAYDFVNVTTSAFAYTQTFQASNNFRISNNNLSSTVSNVYAWDKVLNSRERQLLYDGDKGLDFYNNTIPDSLTYKLEAFYHFDELGGPRYDAMGGLPLVERVNGLLSDNSDKILGRALLNDDSGYLMSQSDLLDIGDTNMTIGVWVKFSSIASSQNIVSNWDTEKSYLIRYDQSEGKIAFNTSGDGVAVTDEVFSNVAVNTGQWYLVIAWHDSDNDKIGIYVNGEVEIAYMYGGLFTPASSDIRIASGALRLDNLMIWSRVLLFQEMNAIYSDGTGLNFVSPIPDSLNKQLFAHWKMEEESGTRYDDVYESHLADNNTVTFDTGIIDTAASFDESNSEYLDLNTPNFVATHGDFSWSFWIYLPQNPSGSYNGVIGVTGNSSNTRNYIVWIDSNRELSFRIYSDGTIVSGPTIPLTTWTHVVVNYDNTNDEVTFVMNDGTPITGASGKTELPFVNGIPVFGNDPSSTGRFLTGRLDQVHHWTRQLTAGEITQLYNAGAAYNFSVDLERDLVANWEMNELSGDRKDASSNGYHLLDMTMNGNTQIENSRNVATLVRSNSQYFESDIIMPPTDTSEFSFVVWFNVASLGFGGGGERTIMTMYGDENQFLRVYSRNFRRLRVDLETSSGNVRPAQVTMSSQTYMLYITVKPNDYLRYQLYDIGGLVADNQASINTLSLPSTNLKIRFGTRANTDRFMDGWVGNARYYHRLLSQTEIAYLYNNGSGLPFTLVTPIADMYGHWLLNETHGDRVDQLFDYPLTAYNDPRSKSINSRDVAVFEKDTKNSYMTTNQHIILPTSGQAYSFTFWLSSYSDGWEDRVILALQDDTGLFFEIFLSEGGLLTAKQRTDSSVTISDTATLNIGYPNTHYFVYAWIDPATTSFGFEVYDGSGSQVHDITTSLDTNTWTLGTEGTHQLTVGADIDNANVFDGWIADVRYFHKLLSGGDITTIIADEPNLAQSSVTPNPVSKITDDLVSHWKLDEISGIRYDSHGNVNLTDHNTVTSVAGQIGNAARFDDTNNEYLSATTDEFNFSGSLTISCWIWLDDLTGNSTQNILCYWPDASNNVFLLRQLGFSVNGLQAYLYTTNNDSVEVNISETFATAEKWHFVVIRYNADTRVFELRLNENQIARTVLAHDRYSDGTSQLFEIGARDSDQFWDGNIDSVSIWRRYLTDFELQKLFNSGNGLDYPFVDEENSILTGLVSSWSMDEKSGERRDSHSISHLTDYNTVGYNTGQVGGASVFVSGNSEYLQNSDKRLMFGGDITIAGWVKFTSNPGGNFYSCWAQWEAGDSAILMGYRGSDDTFTVNVKTSGDTSNFLAIPDSNFGLNVWHFFVFRYTESTKLAELRLNETHFDSITLPSSRYATTSSPLTFGKTGSGGGHANEHLDNISVWNRPLEDSEIAQIYNNGYGLAYPFKMKTGLITQLISHWKLDEVSGNRIDSHGSNNLTDNNTVGFATGKLGNSAQFSRSDTDYLSNANAIFDPGNFNFTWALWVKLENKSDNAPLINRMALTPNQEYQIVYNDVNDVFRFRATHTGVNTDFAVLDADSFGAPSTGVWYFVVAWHDADANTINIQVNNGTVDSLAFNSAGVYNAGNDLVIGGRLDSSSYSDAELDSVSYWTRLLTEDERTQLYNNGDALDYEDF